MYIMEFFQNNIRNNDLSEIKYRAKALCVDKVRDIYDII